MDDFRPGNPPSHPELLEGLAENFRRSGYDLKHLMRAIAQSGTYQLSGDLNPTNREDAINHSRALPRRLDAEILLDAISRVTGVEEAFAVHNYVRGGTEPKGTRAIELVPEVTPSQFLEVYGRPISRDSMPWARLPFNPQAGPAPAGRLHLHHQDLGRGRPPSIGSCRPALPTGRSFRNFIWPPCPAIRRLKRKPGSKP